MFVETSPTRWAAEVDRRESSGAGKRHHAREEGRIHEAGNKHLDLPLLIRSDTYGVRFRKIAIYLTILSW